MFNMDNYCLMMTVKEFLQNEDSEYKIISGTKAEEEEKTIRLVVDRTYFIPAYQREIRWTEENVNILINDIMASKKFLGTILLNKSNNDSYEIIDGQQRISVFILILKAISKINSEEYNLCKFLNQTYKCLFEVLDLNFDLEEINCNANANKYLDSDILEQRERFEIIWKTIYEKLKKMCPEELRRFRDNLLFSEINIIFADSRNSRIYVDYYLDLNDKSVKLDNIDILKANLFKINYELMSNKWAEVQKSIKKFRMAGLNYSLATFFYHYFACSVNYYLDFKLTKLKTDLKFEKTISIRGFSYEAGTNILRAISNQTYFKTAIKELQETADFFKCVYENDGLRDLKDKLLTNKCSRDTIECIFFIISAILHIDDEVPKILIMKYFLDVLNKEKIQKQDVKLIFYIYVYSILFTLTAGKKESSKLIRIVLARDWMEKIKIATIEFYKVALEKINYFKPVTEKGKVTNVSGQYLPKHIMAIKEFANVTSGTIKFNEKKLRHFLQPSTCTAEHFFINKSCKVKFCYGTDNKTAEFILPKKMTKYISCPVNYLYLDSDVNNNLENKSLKEKIDNLVREGRNAFSSDMSFNYFEKIAEVFNQLNNFPELNSYNNKAKALRALREYYNEHLVDLMKKYVEKVKLL